MTSFIGNLSLSELVRATTVIADTDRPSGRWDLWTTSPWPMMITFFLTFAAFFVCFGLRLLAIFRSEISSFMDKIPHLIMPTISNHLASTPLPGCPATSLEFPSTHESFLNRAPDTADRSSDVAIGNTDGLHVNSLASPASAEDAPSDRDGVDHVILQIESMSTSSRDGDGLEYDDEFIVSTDTNVSHIRPNSLNTSHSRLLCPSQHWV